MSDTNSDKRNPSVYPAGLLCREAAGDSLRPIPLVGDRLRIGRRFENDLIVSHASVSRFHAEILKEGEDWIVVDCESKFGTSVNGERIVRAVLAPGDEIRIGTSDGPLIIFNPANLAASDDEDDDDATLKPPAAGDDLPPEAFVSDPKRTQPAQDSESPGTPSGDALRLVEQFRATSLIGDYHEALALVADAALELTHYDRAALMLVDRADSDNGSLRLEVARTRSGRNVSADSGREVACVREAVASSKLVQIHPGAEMSAEEREIARAAAAAGIERIVCVPLRSLAGQDLVGTREAKPSTVGALYLEAGPGATPVDGIRTVLESLAGEAALVVERLAARQSHAARVRSQLAVRVARKSAQATDTSLSLAIRGRAACELLTDLLTIGDLEGARAALEPFEDPEVRSSLPDGTRAEILKAIGIVMMWQGTWHRAAGLLNAALDGAVEGQNVVLEMSIRACLARCYAEIGEFSMARDHAMTAVSVLRRVDETSIDYARALLALGVLEQLEGDAMSAIHAFRLALRVAERTDDLLACASAHYRLGLLQAGRGDTAAAIASFQQALEVAHPSGNTMLALVGKVALATALVRSGAWRRAEAVIASALATAVDPRHARIRVRLLLLAAMIAVWRDGTEVADNAIASVRAQASEAGDEEVLAEVDLLEAELCLDRRDPAGARRLLAVASDGARERGDGAHRVRSHILLSEVERQAGNRDAADRHVGLAQRAIVGQRDLSLAGLVQRAAGRQNAERGQFTEAQHHFAQGLSIFRTLDDRRQVGGVHLDLGNLMLAANDPACARTHLLLARSIFADLGVSASLAAVEAGLSRAVASVGAEAPATYSSSVLAARSEPRFVRRLLEATQSRDLVLRELTSIAIDVARATHASVVSCRPDGYVVVTAVSGDQEHLDLPTLGLLKAASGEIVRTRDVTIYPIEPIDASTPATSSTVLAVNVELRENSRHDAAMQTVVQMARQGLELVTLRASLKRADLPSLPGLNAADHRENGGVTEPGLLYASGVMRQLGERINRIRTSSATVLITGESGVGKELVARAIHNAGPNALKPFVPFNCSAAPRELIESQIFGYRRGAFTGATADSPGVARAARGGTLFLDEVGDLPLEIQPKLLRFLEYGEIQPLGETAPLHVDVRLIAATNMDLERAVSERRFREDLFHRLNIIRLHVPPLRDRSEDIPLLVAHFLEELARRAGMRQPPPLAEAALSALVRFPWPGNVRQLRNEIERLVTFCEEGATITRDLLSEELRTDDESFARAGGGGLSRPYDPVSIPLADRLRLFEVEQINRALADSSMNLTRASAQLGMARQNLQRRIKKLGLRVPDSSLTE